ncbi:MAG: lactate racemase domain-containing protein [Candidatus Thorarchaeota archaeon]|jgi:nickel-dependent lactate racemase
MSYHSTPLNYGGDEVDEFIPKSVEDVTILQVDEYTPDFTDLKKKLNEVLESPIGSNPLDVLVKDVYEEGKRILFMVDDKTRPNIHTKILLPLIAERLLTIGVRHEDIGIIISSGTHVLARPSEVEDRILGPDLYKIWGNNVLAHDCDRGNTQVGETSRGTPILIDQQVLDACLLIPLSDSEYHYFAGQAGTVKLFCPGVAGRETIRVNHPRMFDVEKGFIEGCRLGNCDGNPVIEDMIEITSIMKEKIAIFCVDTIVHHGEIVYLQAGDIIECHKAAASPLRDLRVVDVDAPGDIVFVSVGKLGVNLYQAGKGTHAAWNALRHDRRGWIVLLAPCEDGIGSSGYEEAMHAAKDLEVQDALRFVIETFGSEETFKIGNQKPPDLFRILLDVAEGDIKVISGLDPDELRSIYRMEGCSVKDSSEVQKVLRDLVDRFLKEHPNPKVYVLDDPGLLINVKNQIH